MKAVEPNLKKEWMMRVLKKQEKTNVFLDPSQK